MPKYSTIPTLYDECKTISISKLKQWGFLAPEQYKSGIITWSRNGEQTGRISISVCTSSKGQYVLLDYKYKETPIEYRVPLVYLPSNLDRGNIPYFVCPATGKRCRLLYLDMGYFLHRTAITGMYEKQTLSHKTRALYRNLDSMNKAENAQTALLERGMKRFYKGKPTKRFKKMLNAIKRGNSFRLEDFLYNL